MNKMIVFALLTGLCWGVYGPALALSRTALGSPFKPYVMIGVAYLIWGILGGLGGMKFKGDNFNFTGLGTFWGFVAGSLGAWGALTLTLAMFNGGAKQPQVVMATVFGSAVTIAALVGWIQTGHGSPGLWAGMVLVLLGILMVTYFTPHAPPSAPPAQPTPGSGAAIKNA